MPITLDDIRNALVRHGLAARAAEILSYVKPAVRIHATKFLAGKPLAPGESMFAGPVHLPTGQQWPMSSAGRAMRRLAQIRLSDVAPHDTSGQLPRRGLLSFWLDEQGSPWGYEPEDRDKFRVLYSREEAVAQTPARRPAKYGDWEAGELEPYAQCRLTFEPTLMLPPDEWAEFTTDGVEHRQFAIHAYGDVLDSIGQLDNCFHTLLGYTAYVQNPGEPVCQFASRGIANRHEADPGAVRALTPGIADWVLLLQLDTDREGGPGWLWGDCGDLFFWIRKQDLAAANFDNCWMTMECA